ncbi:hypothetical protein E2C01_020707 [Portunus trituberculatus]|uniref:Uncharacterized protein n=1 Tax=Portunus trituberculatus TaxID=210409 RepID=A0A5B7E298_PORTR|nr:hypothetical protein [Portunus trituberculatus]
MPAKGEGGARDMPLHPHVSYDTKCKTSSVRCPGPRCSPRPSQSSAATTASVNLPVLLVPSHLSPLCLVCCRPAFP